MKQKKKKKKSVKKFVARSCALPFTMLTDCFDYSFSVCDDVIFVHGSDSETDTTGKLSLEELMELDDMPQTPEPSQSMVTTRSKCKYHRLFSLVTD